MDVYAGQLDDERVLVTGGAGFIGSNVVHRLLERGATVTVLDDFHTGLRDNLTEHPRLTIVEGDVTDVPTVERLVPQVSTVIHLAARNIIQSTRDPLEDYQVNIGGTLRLLLAARACHTRRFVYGSSASIYGNPRHLPIDEEDAPNTLSPYAVSKLAGESYCRAFYESYGVSTAVVRYSNVYGIRQRTENPYCGVVAKFFEAARNGAVIKVHGDGEQSRDYTYVTDVVDATIAAAYSPKAEGQVYNVGTGVETSVNELARRIIAVCGSSSTIESIDRRDIDNIRRRVVNIERIRRELRWTPTVTLASGLARTYQWLCSQGQRA